MIITIGGQYGSGGFETGNYLAKKLNYRIYDKDLIEKVTSKSDRESFNTIYDEDQPISTTGGFRNATLDLQLDVLPIRQGIQARQYSAASDGKLVDALTKVINEEADKGDVIFLGRCADYILHGRDDVLSIFTRDKLDNRISRISKIYGVNEKEAKKLIDLTDKRRADYYSATTGHHWGDSFNYDLTVNTGRLGGVEKLAELIEYIIKSK